MIEIISDNLQRVVVEVRSDRLVLQTSTTGQIHINRDDARQLRRLLEMLG